MNEFFEPQAAIIGEQAAGHSKEVRKKLELLVKNLNKSTFDVGELLNEVKSNHYYQEWGFNTFKEYVAELEIKLRKAQYLSRIFEVMNAVNISRNDFEPVGISKLREITSLDYTGSYYDEEKNENIPLTTYIIDLIYKANTLTLDEIKAIVKKLKGLTGENELVWLNIYVKKAALDEVISPAFALAKNNIGTSLTDDDGEAIEPSDGAALEVIALDYKDNPMNLPQSNL